jgi:hypothetical protein
MIAIGIANLLFPRTFWYLSEGWKFKNSEPSNTALVIIRVIGFFIFISSFFAFYIYETFILHVSGVAN